MDITEELRAKLEKTASRLAARPVILYFHDAPTNGDCGWTADTHELAIRLNPHLLSNVPLLLQVFLHEAGHAAYSEFKPVYDIPAGDKIENDQAATWWQGACVVGGYPFRYLPKDINELGKFLDVLMKFGKEKHIIRNGKRVAVTFKR